MLFCRGCDKTINDTDKKGHTALWYAIKYRNSCAAIKLVENGANFKSRAKDKNHEVCETTVYVKLIISSQLPIIIII